MAEWITPVTDRTESETSYARNNQSNVEYNKGALSYADLNRIENNHKYIIDTLKTEGYYIPHTYRNWEETTFEIVYVETEYTTVEYIESSGNQFIDTGFKPNQDTKVVVDFHLIEGGTKGIFGARTSFDSLTYIFIAISDNYRSDYNNTVGSIISVTNQLSRMTVVKDKNVTTIDGNSDAISYSSFQCEHSMYLFACNNSGSEYWQSKMRLYSCKIYDNGTLVRDFIPVKDASGVACLYDKVSQTYFYNAGTGSFTAGAELPKETTKEIIEVKRTYTDWQEHNLTWLSEINRIRLNHNNLAQIFLCGFFHDKIAYSNYLNYVEANTLEDILQKTKETYDNMQKQRLICGTFSCGGDLL